MPFTTGAKASYWIVISVEPPNRGPARARVLILFSPSGDQHEYFRELERLFAAPSLDAAALQALQKQYDQELIPPPQ